VLYRYILTQRTLSRSSDLNSWDTLYIHVYRNPKRRLSQFEKYNYAGERKTTGWGDAIASKERDFSPLMATLENRFVTLFHSVDMVSGIPLVSITQNEHF
jgi:hypothetical protein